MIKLIYHVGPLLLLPSVIAFTNGTLVPAYLCNPVADGMPKTFGQVLASTVERTPIVGFSPDVAQNVAAPPLPQQNASTIGNAAYILASLHSSPNSLETQQNPIIVTPANGNVIQAGQAVPITISTRDASQLKGAVLLAQDGAGQRQGSFTDAPGGAFIPFAGCGLNAQGQISGVIQQRGITADSSYSQLVYNAPLCVPGDRITFAGLSVTGTGFGQWQQTFVVSGSACAANGTLSRRGPERFASRPHSIPRPF